MTIFSPKRTHISLVRSSAADTLSSGNISDLVFTNHELESLIEGTTVQPNGFDSDHCPVSFVQRLTGPQSKIIV